MSTSSFKVTSTFGSKANGRQLSPRTDISMVAQKISVHADHCANHEAWVKANAPKEDSLKSQRQYLSVIITEAARYQLVKKSTFVEKKAEEIRAQGRRLSGNRSTAYGLTAQTVKMLRADMDVIFENYEQPYEVSMKALQGFQLWRTVA